MRVSRNGRLVSLAVVIVLCLSASFDLWAQARGREMSAPVQISGLVRMDGGTRPPEGVMVDLEFQSGGQAQSVRVDPSGKFTFEGLGPGVFLVRVRYPGFHEIVERVDATMSPRQFVSMVLKPLPGTNPTPPEGPNATISAVPEKAQQQLDKGKKKLEKGDAGGAVNEFKKAIDAYPNYSEAYFWMGSALMDQGKFAEAQAALQKAIDLDSNNGVAYLALGSSYNRIKNYTAAEPLLVKVVQISPDAMQAHYELSTAYWGLNRNDEAEQYARKAIALKADFAPAHVLLGNVLLRKRDYAGSRAAFQEYLRLEPNGPMSTGVRDMVTKLEKEVNRPN
jgi:tetratricopeptide (TPR) repeat protein